MTSTFLKACRIHFGDGLKRHVMFEFVDYLHCDYCVTYPIKTSFGTVSILPEVGVPGWYKLEPVLTDDITHGKECGIIRTDLRSVREFDP